MPCKGSIVLIAGKRVCVCKWYACVRMSEWYVYVCPCLGGVCVYGKRKCKVMRAELNFAKVGAELCAVA